MQLPLLPLLPLMLQLPPQSQEPQSLLLAPPQVHSASGSLVSSLPVSEGASSAGAAAPAASPSRPLLYVVCELLCTRANSGQPFSFGRLCTEPRGAGVVPDEPTEWEQVGRSAIRISTGHAEPGAEARDEDTKWGGVESLRFWGSGVPLGMLGRHAACAHSLLGTCRAA